MLIPDRKPDMVKTTPMADEMRLMNVIRLTKEGDEWRARIGPPIGGLSCVSRSRFGAVVYLLAQCEGLRWEWDETWFDHLE